MPFGIQPIHLILVAIVALLIFGPSRLPEIGRGIGRALTEFRRGAKDMTEGFKEEVSKPVDGPENTIMPAPVGSQPAAVVPAQPMVVTMTSTAEPAAGRVFCNQCGAPNPVGAQFCNKCGTRIEVG